MVGRAAPGGERVEDERMQTGGLWRVGGFTELRELGTGAQGRVVLARDDEGGGPVAIKYLERRDGDQDGIERLRQEASLLARVTDPHVVRPYRFVSGAQGAALVMEAVDGASLKDVLERSGALEPEAALLVLKGSLQGLAAAHALGIVHRDYKPANVVVQGDGVSKLIDFGVATLAGAGSRAGTPAYMAPEQWRGEPAMPATDVYAATCVFFECVTGRRPFEGALAVVQDAHLNQPPSLDGVPPMLHDLITRGMAKDAIGRPEGAAAFVDELDATAVRTYGPDWEQRGIRALSVAAVALAALFPLTAVAMGSGGAVGAGAAAGGTAGAAAGGSAAGGSVAGASGASGGVLATTGAKVALAVGTATVVAAGGGTAAYVASGPDDPPPQPEVRPVAAVSTMNRSTPLQGLPPLQVQDAQYVAVDGIGDQALRQRVNNALRAPLDRRIRAFQALVEANRGNPGADPACARVNSRASIRYSSARLVSVLYTFDTRTCTVADETGAPADTVTIDLRTGRELDGPAIFRDLGPAAIAALSRALDPTSGQRECLGGGLERRHFIPDGGPGAQSFRVEHLSDMEVTFTPSRVEFRLTSPSPAICTVETYWRVPYPDVIDQIKPGVAALLPVNSPKPEPS